MVITKHSFPIMVAHTTRYSRDKWNKPYAIFCITFRHSPSSHASFQQITFSEYTIYFTIFPS